MQKYALVRKRILNAAWKNSIELCEPLAATHDQLRRVHTKDYVNKITHGLLSAKEIRRMGFPWSPELVERSRRSTGGTIGACRAALEEGITVNLAGGTHHAFPDFGAGFCVFNDAAVAALAMLTEEHVQRIAILDCDVHQGDGTAVIFAEDSRVFTFSVHGAKNFPFHKQQSDLDIELDDGTPDEVYLNAVENGVNCALALAEPDLVIYLAGADPYIGDRLGRLAVSKQGLSQRDSLVLNACRAQNIPVAVVMAGGYAREITDIVDIHAETVRIAAQQTP